MKVVKGFDVLMLETISICIIQKFRNIYSLGTKGFKNPTYPRLACKDIDFRKCTNSPE